MIKIKSFLKSYLPYIVYYGLALYFMLGLAILQPYAWPPDEDARYRIVAFIRNTGFLPLGEEPEVIILGYGGSYAYMPILPYIVMGYLQRFLSLFISKKTILLVIARCVNVFSGLIMAVFVRKTSKKLFSQENFAWLFCFLVMFLPQLLFLHTYVNTDSFALTSGSIIIYGALRGREDNWSVKSCLILSAGIIICALSYYNAYGFIVLAVLLYVTSYIDKTTVLKKDFFKKAAFISVVVLAGCGWWFIRNAIIHNGDFLGLYSQAEYATRSSLPEFNPALRETVHSTGVSLREMVFGGEYITLVTNSFIACFEAMNVYTYPVAYGWYIRIFKLGLLGLIIPVTLNGEFLFINPKAGSKGSLKGKKAVLQKAGFHLSMITGIIIPIALSLIYSYYYDYQPQGRYVMPMLMPFMYYIALGLSKVGLLGNIILKKLIPESPKWLEPGWLLSLVIILFFTAMVFATFTGVLLPRYMPGNNLFNINTSIFGDFIALP